MDPEKIAADIPLKNDHEIRRDAFVKLAPIISKYVLEEDLLKAIKDTEKGIYCAAIREAIDIGVNALWDNFLFVELYADHLRRILVNFDKKSHVKNSDVVDVLSNYEFKNLATLSSQELSPSVWEPIFEERRKKEEALLQAKSRQTKDTLIKCRKCGSKNIYVQTQQLRSADEGMTNIITCQDCGHVKKS